MRLVTISEKEYFDLLESQQFLDALESMGVDNWSGYDEAQSLFREWQEEGEEEIVQGNNVTAYLKESPV